ncbi:DUF2299 domain-containing protein [Hyperthermus butylicus]|uniref:Conserved crenarchaeal protein n=1 Tax=Hyperthermus butylicus (strain DSM 5456 / JCM 9403 / PLM1-5) TaxID=415426 RepID=A2BJX4_HYPBU|nr:DUF2299 domain-containing protein [Hyperthermus butylicus]ABM80285.1 conserved crenarchaeal protein [Hyperthermus butylicus DSM 5456]
MQSTGEQLKDRIAGWLAGAGFIVVSFQGPLPSNAEWGLLVSTPPPLQVKLRVMGLRGGAVTLGIGVNISEHHRKLIEGLSIEERVRLTASMLEKLLMLCPYCRVALQGSLGSPVGIIAEIYIDGAEATKQRIVDDAARLVNIFLLINSILWKRFPATSPERSGTATPSSFM